MASVSSAPSVSITTLEPLAAASIMTPMMLFALTRRPLRLSQMSAWNWPATCVSLAEARACRPSLLVISTSRCSIVERQGRDAHDAFTPAADRLTEQRCEWFFAVCKRADEHGQIDPGHTFHATWDEYF